MAASRTLSSILTAAVAMVSRASAQLVLVAVTLVATRYLDPAAFGTFSLAAIGITLVRSILWNGATEYLMKARTAQEVASECLAINLLVTLVASLPLLLLSWGADRIFDAPGMGHLILLLLPSNLLAGVAAWQEALLLRTGRLRAYYAITFASEAISAAAAVALLLDGQGALALVAQTYARNALQLVAYVATRSTIWSTSFSRARAGEVLGWSVSRYASVLVDFGASYGADIFLGLFLSPAAAGLYRASNRIVTAVGEMFAHPANMIARSVFSARAAAGRPSDDVWPLVFSAAAVVGWAAMGGVAVTSDLVVPFALGPLWAGAAPLVAIIAVSRAGLLVQAIVSALMVAYDRQNRLFALELGATAATLVALAATAWAGVLAATIAVAAVSIATSVIMGMLAFRLAPEARPLFLAELPIVLVPTAATMIAAGGARLLARDLPTAADALIAILCGVAAWALALVPLRRRIGRAFAALSPEPA